MADEIPAPGPPRLEPLSVVWHVFAAPQTLLILMALLALVLVAAGLIPQASFEGLSESESWLAVERGPLSRYADLARALGLFDLYHAVWFRFLLALVALALLVRAVDATELAWRAGRRGEWRTLLDLSWFHRAQQVDLTASAAPDHVHTVSTGLLEEEGYDWSQVEGNGKSGLVALYHPRRLWLRPLGYVALLVVGAGLLVATTQGWQGEVWQPLPLEIEAVGHGTAGAVRLDAFDLRFNARGQLVNYRSRITWLRDGAEVQPGVASVGQPARLDGVALRQIGYAPVARLSARSADGRPLLIQMPGQPSPGQQVVTARFLSPDDQPLAFLPQSERFLTLVFEPACNTNGPALHIYEIEQAGRDRQRVATLRDSGRITLDEVQMDIELFYVPVLRLDYRPGVTVALAGLGVALLALIGLWLFPTRLLWLAVVPRGSVTQIEYRILPGASVWQRPSSLAAWLAEAVGSDD